MTATGPRGDTVRFDAVGDRAVLVVLAEAADEAVRRAVRDLDRALRDEPVAGQVELVPALVDLLVAFDPLVTDHDAVAAAVRERLAGTSEEPPEPASHVLPVCYDRSLAPDLADVAEARGMAVDAVVEAHLAATYRVALYGFAPGYAYLSGVDEAIRVPRKPAAVPGVPAGSVIVADAQCLVTTLTMPTGWSVLGRCPEPVLRPDDDERPFLFDVGDHVRFERIDLATFERLVDEG